MNELLHTILLRVTLAGAASAAALRMAGSGAMRETVRLAAGLLMLAALLQPLGSLGRVRRTGHAGDTRDQHANCDERGRIEHR